MLRKIRVKWLILLEWFKGVGALAILIFRPLEREHGHGHYLLKMNPISCILHQTCQVEMQAKRSEGLTSAKRVDLDPVIGTVDECGVAVTEDGTAFLAFRADDEIWLGAAATQ